MLSKLFTALLTVSLFTGCNHKSQLPEKETNAELEELIVMKKKAPFLWENATVYFLLTDRFHIGDPDRPPVFGRKQDGSPLRSFMGGDIRGIIQKLEEGYFDRLGVTALWMNPMMEQIHGSTDEGTGKSYPFHGYWPKDWTTLDPNFGTMKDYKELIDKAHARGIRVLMDIIVNHTGPVTPIDEQWPLDWVRVGPSCTYEDFESTVSCTLVKNLPDIKTELEEDVALPDFLIRKWKLEGRFEEEQASLDAFFERTGYPRAPKYYIIKWLCDYVKALGIDGFRVDTAKHTEPEVWSVLYKEAALAFNDWKSAHPHEVLDDKAFYMIGEVYGYTLGHGRSYPMGKGRNIDFFKHGFNSLINFSFKEDAKKNPEKLFSSYAKTLQGADFKGKNVLNYVSSHDDGEPFDLHREKVFEAGTKLMLTPGAAQIYYGDELARPLTDKGAMGDANLRSFMNWQDIGKEKGDYQVDALFEHWAKLGTFRKEHPSIGAGLHRQLATVPYTFSRTLERDGYLDKVVVVMGENTGPIDLKGAFAEGELLTDGYSGKTAKVEKGTVDFGKVGDLILIAQSEAH